MSSTTFPTSPPPQHVIVFGLIASAIQMIRLSIVLIQVASANSSPPPKSKNEQQSKVLLSKKSSMNSVDETEGKPTTTSNYGSIDGKQTNSTSDDTKESNTTAANANNVDVEMQSLLANPSSNGTTVTTTTSSPSDITKKVFQLLWFVFFLFYTVVWILPILPLTTKNLSKLSIPSTVLGLVTWTSGLQFIYSVYANCYGFLQRAFHLLSAIFIWCSIVLEVLYIGRQSNLDEAALLLSRFDWTYIIVITVYVLVTLAQFRIMRPTQVCTQDWHAKSEPTFHLSTLRPLLKPYFWPDATSSSAIQNRIRAISTWVCVIISKVCSLISPLYLGWASTALAHGQYQQTVTYSVLYCFISWLGSTLKEAQSLVYLKVAQAAFVQLSETAFGHLHSLSLDWHLRKKLGEVIRSMDRGIAACDTLMKYLFLWLVPAIVECLVVCIIFATYFHYLPLAVTVFYFVMIYIIWTILVTIWRKQYRKALTKSDNEWHDRFTDSLINFETVKFFTAENYEKERFKQAVTTYQAGSVDVQASLSFLNISQQIILKLCLAVALGMTAISIKQHTECCITVAGCESGISDCCSTGAGAAVCSSAGIQVGDFVAVLTYTLNLFAPLNFLGSVYNAVVMAVVDLTNMSELLSESPDVTDSPTAIALPPTPPNDIVVEFDNVHFNYPTQPEARGLKGLSFKMKRGTTTAIVGPTGAGKTTVSRLLFRFYDALGGAVKIHGLDVRSVTQDSLRRAIGVVPQTASMFNDTLRSNLLYGRRDATEEELVQAARDAQLLPFIESLDEGWETLVGDRGLKLSGGERQRAAIARCLLKDPPIVLLDEATSALDTITEKSVQEALDRLGTDRTVLVIAHRLGTIRNADNIIVLKDGVAAEQGTHDELLQLNGIYADMWNMQLHSTPNAT